MLSRRCLIITAVWFIIFIVDYTRPSTVGLGRPQSIIHLSQVYPYQYPMSKPFIPHQNERGGPWEPPTSIWRAMVKEDVAIATFSGTNPPFPKLETNAGG